MVHHRLPRIARRKRAHALSATLELFYGDVGLTGETVADKRGAADLGHAGTPGRARCVRCPRFRDLGEQAIQITPNREMIFRILIPPLALDLRTLAPSWGSTSETVSPGLVRRKATRALFRW